MQDAYLIVHGFMDADDTFVLIAPLHTYVTDGNMLDGRKTAAIVTQDPSRYNMTSDEEKWSDKASEFTSYEHYLCSDIASYSDINRTQKW